MRKNKKPIVPSKKRYPRTLLATACVPWDKNYVFDEKIFRLEIRDLINSDVNHIYVFGTAGEGYAVSDSQFDAIVKAFADEMNGPDLHPMVGIVSLSLATMLERIERAYSFGIRDFQFALPSWSALSDSELFTFFHNLCDHFPDCRFFHYNLMRSKRILNIKEYEALADEIPNFVGVKYSTRDMDVIHQIVTSNCPLQFFLLEVGYGYGSMLGECGFLISLASSNFKRAWEYFNAGVEKNYEKLVRFNKELYSILSALHRITGKPKMDGAYDKMFSRIMIPHFPLRLLPPHETNSVKIFNDYHEFLKRNYPQWLK